MDNAIDAEYLKKPFLEGLNITIDADYLRIASTATIHGEARLHKRFSKTELYALYMHVLRVAKEKNVKIGYRRHYRREMYGILVEYGRACTAADELFGKIITQAKVVEARGLHYGTRDDAELEKLQTLCGEYNKNFWRDAVISKMEAIYFDLEEMLNDIAHMDSNGQCTVYL